MKMKLWAAAAVIAATSLTGCMGGGNKAAGEQDAQEQKIPVKVSPAVRETVTRSEDFTANLQAYKQNFIVPGIAARIDDIYAEVGDKVSAGQVLVELDKTQLNTTALQLANAEANMARMEPVFESGGISKQQMDELETNIDILRESVGSLRDNLTLCSPIGGVVTGRYNEEGDLFMMSPNADGGVGILRVMQMDRLKAYIHISEGYFNDVRLGMPVRVVADVFPGEEFSGSVTRIAPAINPATRTFEVEVTIPNSSLKLRPGMYARTTINMGEAEGITVDDTSIQRQAGTNDKYVYVIADGVASKRMVTTGRQTGSRIEITSGVGTGEDVVTAGASRLIDGSKVEISAN